MTRHQSARKAIPCRLGVRWASFQEVLAILIWWNAANLARRSTMPAFRVCLPLEPCFEAWTGGKTCRHAGKAIQNRQSGPEVAR